MFCLLVSVSMFDCFAFFCEMFFFPVFLVKYINFCAARETHLCRGWPQAIFGSSASQEASLPLTTWRLASFELSTNHFDRYPFGAGQELSK